MKRLLLLPVLMLGLSFACDQPYEEVAGIKIGCPFDRDPRAGVRSKNDSNVIEHKLKLEDSFFQNAQIDTLSGSVEVVAFTNIYSDTGALGRDSELLFKALAEKWGEFDIVSDDIEFLIHINRNPQSDALNSIMITRSVIGNQGVLSVTYISEKMNQYTEAKNLKEKAEKTKQLDSF